MRGAQGAAADSHHHGPVPVDQDRKRCLGRRGVPVQESSQQFAVGQAAQRSVVKERFELRVDVGECFGRHRVVSRGLGSSACSFPSSGRLLQLYSFCIEPRSAMRGWCVATIPKVWLTDSCAATAVVDRLRRASPNVQIDR